MAAAAGWFVGRRVPAVGYCAHLMQQRAKRARGLGGHGPQFRVCGVALAGDAHPSGLARQCLLLSLLSRVKAVATSGRALASPACASNGT